MKYSAILVDTMNCMHRIKALNVAEPAVLVSNKYIYKSLVANFIERMRALESAYLEDGGKLYLLFDNPTSRFDLQKSFYFAQRKHLYPKYKEQRAKESKEFYNSLDLIRYYYLTNLPKYVCIQVQNLEADDLVKPVIKEYCKDDDRILMVTNDYDWTRYLALNVDWLPETNNPPQTVQDFINKKGFYPTEQSVIAYKSIFGDPADNIPQIITENAANMTEFVELYRANTFLDPESLISFSCQAEMVKRYKIIKAIRENEKQFRINIQLTATIPVSRKHLEAVTCKGRNATIVTESIETVIGLRTAKKEFVFGQLKKPKGA